MRFESPLQPQRLLQLQRRLRFCATGFGSAIITAPVVQIVVAMAGVTLCDVTLKRVVSVDCPERGVSR